MWEAVDCLSDFDVDKSILGMLVEVVLLYDVLGENVEGHFHVFISCHGCAEVEVFDVDAHVPGSWCADGAVPHDFGSC